MNKNRRTAKNYNLTNGVIYDLHITSDTHIHVTEGNEKLGKGVYNYSLLPGDEPLKLKNGIQVTNICGTCNGCCEFCKNKCYAVKAALVHHNVVIKAWGENTMLAREDMETFFNELQIFINRNEVSVMRVHVGGEFFSYDYMYRTMLFIDKNRDIDFYFYTKRYEWLEAVEDAFNGKLPENVHPWVSECHFNYDNPRGFAEFHWDDGTDPRLEKMFHCPAVNKQGHETGVTCSMCKRCRNGKKGDKIAVYEH